MSPVLADHGTKIENSVNSFPLSASFFDHLSLWDATNGILVVRRNSPEPTRTLYPRLSGTMNSSVTVARPAMPYAAPSYDEWVAAMLDPMNRTGGTDPLSRNFHWGISLFGLPGRGRIGCGPFA
ncbi:MAG: hypothetical protein ABIZ95_08970 [Pyrinomonadaceae bacterium]